MKTKKNTKEKQAGRVRAKSIPPVMVTARRPRMYF